MRMILLSVFLSGFFVSSCSSQALARPSQFPLNKGTRWVYSYEAYEQSANPDQILRATYQLTESVVDVETISAYFVAHVKRDHRLIKADDGWMQDFSSQPNEVWYIVKDTQVFHSDQSLDTAHIKLDDLMLDYQFPLSIDKSWCFLPKNSKNPKQITGCDFVGKREVTSQGSYESSVGKFDDCYDMIDYWNGGNFFRKFCSGMGIVSVKFDHAGTRFGFEQTLIQYSIGNP